MTAFNAQDIYNLRSLRGFNKNPLTQAFKGTAFALLNGHQTKAERLEMLRNAWDFASLPLSNFIAFSPMPANEFLASLRKLEETKMIKLVGPGTLDDLGKMISQAGPLEPPVAVDVGWGPTWTLPNSQIFDDEQGRCGVPFLDTDVRLTFRGFFFLRNTREDPKPEQVLAEAPSRHRTLSSQPS
jgi:hypothetical protein